MKTKYNYKKLNGKIVEIFGTADNMAKAISMNRSTLSKKLNNHVDFSSKDIDRIRSANIFFVAKVEKTQLSKWR